MFDLTLPYKVIEPCTTPDRSPEDTPFAYTVSLISGRYKMMILYGLYQYKAVMRFNEMKRYLNRISYKTLSVTLKELERDGLILRTEYPQVPPKVEYRLTEKGYSLIPVLNTMCDWGEKNQSRS